MSMGLTRFIALAEAYGGDIARWPEADQAGARAVLADAPAARAALAEAARLDALLALDTAPAPSDLLQRRVLRAAPAPARRVSRLGFASGAGWAAAAAAGVMAGVLVGNQALAPLRAEASYEQAQAWSLDEGDYFG
jgi:ferric-dicitrate binding protein FerR (iron transport regulator)